MNLEIVQKRKEQLVSEKEMLKSNILAYDGAILDCDYWIEQLIKEEDNGSNDKSD